MDFTLILVTVLSLALATVMTAIAWRLAREERRRSDLRVAALATEIERRPQPMHDLPMREEAAPRAVATSGDLFSAAEPSRSAPRLAAVVAIGAFIIVTNSVCVWGSDLTPELPEYNINDHNTRLGIANDDIFIVVCALIAILIFLHHPCNAPFWLLNLRNKDQTGR